MSAFQTLVGNILRLEGYVIIYKYIKNLSYIKKYFKH